MNNTPHHHARFDFVRTVAFGLACAVVSVVHAEPIWHCSKSHLQAPQPNKSNYLQTQAPSKDEIIRLSIRDLYEAYQDMPVTLGRQRLIACFLEPSNPLSQEALGAIGADAQEVQEMAQHSKHLIQVADESEMLQCIGLHHPAIGYVSRPINTPQVGPCF